MPNDSRILFLLLIKNVKRHKRQIAKLIIKVKDYLLTISFFSVLQNFILNLVHTVDLGGSLVFYYEKVCFEKIYNISIAFRRILNLVKVSVIFGKFVFLLLATSNNL